jgi:hypothetical protein
MLPIEHVKKEIKIKATTYRPQQKYELYPLGANKSTKGAVEKKS